MEQAVKIISDTVWQIAYVVIGAGVAIALLKFLFYRYVFRALGIGFNKGLKGKGRQRKSYRRSAQAGAELYQRVKKHTEEFKQEVDRVEPEIGEDLYDLFKGKKKGSDRNYSEDLMDQGDAYVARTHLMSPTERNVYKVLERGYGDKYYIFCQVRVVDLIQPNVDKYHSKSKEYLSLFRQLSQWHFDYVLCDKSDFRIFCALELDDPSHQRPDRIKRDRILNQACDIAGVNIKRMRVDKENKRICLAK